MKVEEITVTKYQLKQLFEEFNSKILADGISAKYSWFLFKNAETMSGIYNGIMAELFDERREPEFREIWAAQKTLQEKYADRDENGQFVLNNGLPVYTKCAKEYDEEFLKLREAHKEFFTKLDAKERTNMEILNQTVTFQATMLELSEFPANTKPFIVGLLGY